MSFGSAIGAIVSLKNNKRKRAARLDKFQQTTGSKITGVKSRTQLSAEEFQKLSKRIKKENDQKQIKVIVITSLILLILLLVFFYFF